MNQERRERIKKTVIKISECVGELESIKDEEDDSRDNIPENLQGGDAYQQSEDCSDALQDAIDSINEAGEKLGEIT